MKRTFIILLLTAVFCVSEAFGQTENSRLTWGVKAKVDVEIPGKWKNIFTPYLVGIMDAAGTPGVETVIICKSRYSVRRLEK